MMFRQKALDELLGALFRRSTPSLDRYCSSHAQEDVIACDHVGNICEDHNQFCNLCVIILLPNITLLNISPTLTREIHLDRHLELIRDPLQAAGVNAIAILLVLLHLLEAHPNGVTERGLAQTLCRPNRRNATADLTVSFGR